MGSKKTPSNLHHITEKPDNQDFFLENNKDPKNGQNTNFLSNHLISSSEKNDKNLNFKNSSKNILKGVIENFEKDHKNDNVDQICEKYKISQEKTSNLEKIPKNDQAEQKNEKSILPENFLVTKPEPASYKTKIVMHDNGMSPTMLPNNSTIKNWTYLTHNDFRKYQFEITETCLFNNTLVCLPTGLGKTFIAVNIINNFYNWYPSGKLFFLAPTKPLVRQQMESIKNIKNIDQNFVVEITGDCEKSLRPQIYRDKRVFFMTPQTLENDINVGAVKAESIVLLIFDEAHRATGDYAYCKIIEQIEKQTSKRSGYRVIALTATPGNDIASINKVIANCMISTIEVRGEYDPEVKIYLKQKDVQTVNIKKKEYLKLLEEKVNESIDCLISKMKNLSIPLIQKSSLNDIRNQLLYSVF